MKTKAALWRLISSLTEEEYRFINKTLKSNKKESNLGLLFRLYRQLPEYDEQQINIQLQGCTLLKHLPQSEVNLYDQILRIVRAFPHQNHLRSTLLNDLKDIEFLFAHRQFSACRSRIKKVKKIAQKHQYHEILLMLFYWDYQLNGYFIYDLEKTDYLPLRQENYMDYLHQLGDVLKNIRLEQQLLQLIEDKRVTDYPRIPNLLKNYLLEDSLEGIASQPLRSQLYYHLIRGEIYNQAKNWNRAAYHYQTVQDMLPGSELAEQDDFLAIQMTINLFSIHLKVGKLDKAARQAIRAEYWLEHMQRNDLMQFKPFLIQKLQLFYILTEVAEKAAIYNKELEACYHQLFREENKLFLCKIAYQIAHYYFYAGQFEQVIPWIQSFWQYRRILPELIQNSSRLLEIATHFELGNSELLPNLATSYYRFLKKNALQAPAEQLLIRLVQKHYFRSLDDEDMQMHIRQLLQVAREQHKEAPETYFNWQAWLSAHTFVHT